MATPHHHNVSGSTSISTGQADEAVLGPLCYQLSESTSLLLSSGFSADVLVDLFHFWEFSDSSDEDLFCLLHFARLFLNHTCVTEREHTLNVSVWRLMLSTATAQPLILNLLFSMDYYNYHDGDDDDDYCFVVVVIVLFLLWSSVTCCTL